MFRFVYVYWYNSYLERCNCIRLNDVVIVMVLFDGCCDDVRDVDIVVIYFKNDVFIV